MTITKTVHSDSTNYYDGEDPVWTALLARVSPDPNGSGLWRVRRYFPSGETQTVLEQQRRAAEIIAETTLEYAAPELYRSAPSDTRWSIWDTRAQTWADLVLGISEVQLFDTQEMADRVARLMNLAVDVG